MSEPLVTVVISAREGHVLSETSLSSVLADDAIPFDLIYIDNLSPPRIRAAIVAQAQARGFPVLRHDEWIAPASARKQALPLVKTKYAAFIDNDITVERGTLKRLVDCAEETGAGLVSPLYIQAGGGLEPTIHMAGGELEWSKVGGLVAEGHNLSGASLVLAQALSRRRVGYTEYHYVLGRTDLLSRPDVIADDVLLLHEHIDLALKAREHGLEVWLEPRARATYAAFDPRALMDAPFYRRRWDEDACAASLEAFLRRWPNAEESVVGPMRDYARKRLQEFEVRRLGSDGEDLAEPMGADELAQSRGDLRDQALARGYDDAEITALDQACDFATFLFDGLYRPDGRPFLNHVIGTASAMIRYELRAEMVQAALAHAAYSHRPEWISEAEVTRTLGVSPTIERMVRSHPQTRAFLAKGEGEPESFTMAAAEVFCLLAANEIDMRLSGEYRATGRPAELAPAGLEIIARTLAPFGVDGLIATARAPDAPPRPWPLFGAPARHGSFRLDARGRRIAPV